MRFMIGVWLAAVAILLGYGAYTTWHAVVTMPRTYDRLREHGIPVKGVLSDCSAQSFLIRGVSTPAPLRCQVTYTVPVEESRYYPYDLSKQGREGGTIRLLVDPTDLGAAYTLHDIRRRSGAGWGSHAIFGLGLIVAGAALFFGARALQ